jgi:hypothetical protein
MRSLSIGRWNALRTVYRFLLDHEKVRDNPRTFVEGLSRLHSKHQTHGKRATQ